MHTRNNELFNYYARSLLNDIVARFEWRIPVNWDFAFFIYTLYCWGFVGVYDTARFGVVVDRVGLSELGFNYQPTEMVIANPLLTSEESFNRRIGVDGAIIKLSPDYSGVMRTVAYYADELAVITEAAIINAFNSKQPNIFLSKNKGFAEAFKKMYDEIARGEPAVYPDTRLFDANGDSTVQQLTSTAGSNYIVDRLLNDFATVKNQFYTEIGIKNVNINKKERLITAEAEANNDAVASKLNLWAEELTRGIKSVKKLYPEIDLSFRTRGDSNASDPIA